MQKKVLTKAIAVALATLGGGAAMAQSSVTIYGNLDVAFDHVNTKGGYASSVVSAGVPVAATSQSLTRVSPSIASVNMIGFKGTEDLGDGYKGTFVLESQMSPDTGSLGNDNRIFGRQAYVGLTSPFGEVRLGRQYAPMFYTFALTTLDALGSTDIYAAGLTVNNLQVRQDNQISYWLKSGGFLASLAYSTNAGVNERVSARRNTSGANVTNGEILGGITAGTETADKRGQAYGLQLTYIDPVFTVSGSYHGNKFGVPAGAVSATNGLYLPLFQLGDYSGYALAAKFKIPSSGTMFAASFHAGDYELGTATPTGPIAGLARPAGADSAKTQAWGLGVRQPIGDFSIGLEGSYGKFTNFTKGSDKALVFMGDYYFSKRTSLYTRIGQVKDTAGNQVNTSLNGATVIGGPMSGLVSLGSTEIPVFAGAGVNAGGKTSYASIGIRHQF